MATIGTLGKLVFSVSGSTVKTFNNFKWDTAAKYETHQRHLKEPLLEFVGNEPDTITFDIMFSRFHGVSPLGQVKQLHNAKRRGNILKLVIGKKAYGYRWVIISTSTEAEVWGLDGTLLNAKVSLTLKAYAKR